MKRRFRVITILHVHVHQVLLLSDLLALRLMPFDYIIITTTTVTVHHILFSQLYALNYNGKNQKQNGDE